MLARAARLSPWQTWLVSWMLFTVLGGLWAVSSPILSVPDEPSHVAYAAAAVRGQIWAPAVGTQTTVVLPATYANVIERCRNRRYDPEPQSIADFS